jgi:hypothetical protein
MLTLKRDSGYADRARAYKVVLDGKVIGEIRNGEEKTFEISSGAHELVIKIDWCSSNTINFNHVSTTRFNCGSNLRGAKIFLALIYVFFLRNQYVWLTKTT